MTIINLLPKTGKKNQPFTLASFLIASSHRVRFMKILIILLLLLGAFWGAYKYSLLEHTQQSSSNYIKLSFQLPNRDPGVKIIFKPPKPIANFIGFNSSSKKVTINLALQNRQKQIQELKNSFKKSDLEAEQLIGEYEKWTFSITQNQEIFEDLILFSNISTTQISRLIQIYSLLNFMPKSLKTPTTDNLKTLVYNILINNPEPVFQEINMIFASTQRYFPKIERAIFDIISGPHFSVEQKTSIYEKIIVQNLDFQNLNITSEISERHDNIKEAIKSTWEITDQTNTFKILNNFLKKNPTLQAHQNALSLIQLVLPDFKE